MRHLLFLLAAAALSVPHLLHAQDGTAPDTTDLPEIAPQEFEIRGERTPRLPSLERQPLSGFDVVPQRARPDEERQPFVPAYRQTLPDAELDEEIPRPAVESKTHPRQVAFVEGGGGRYTSRWVNGRADLLLGSSELLAISLDYEGMRGRTTDELLQASSYDDGSLEATLASTRWSWPVDLTLQGALSDHALFGSLFPDASRRTSHVGAILQVSPPMDAAISGTIGAAWHLTSAAHSGFAPSVPSARSHGASLEGELSLPASLRGVRITGHLDLAGLEGTTASGMLGVTASAALPLDEQGLTIGPAVVHASTDDRTWTYPSVALELRRQISSELELHVRQRPRIAGTSLHDLLKLNPYLVTAFRFEPEVDLVDAKADLVYSRGAIGLTAGIFWRESAHARYFVREDAGPVGLFDARYGDARQLGVDLEATYVHDIATASLGLSAQYARETELDVALPYAAPLHARLDLYANPLPQWHVGLYATATSARPVYDGPDAPALFRAGGSLRYAFQRTLSVILRAYNLGSDRSNTVWNGYPHAPNVVELGLRWDV